MNSQDSMTQPKSGQPNSLTELSFEKSIEHLEKLVQQLETGKLTLEESLAAFENGVKLTRQCEHMLSDAEKKIEILTKKDGQTGLNDFNLNTSTKEKK